MSMEHSADEAGGEAIFTSDGLPSLSAPLPPPSSSLSSAAGGASGTSATNDNDDIANDAIISEEAVDQRTAFDTFQDAGTGWMGLSHPTKNNVTSVPSSSGGWEDPRRKLFQLKSEIDSLEKTLLEQQQRQQAEDDNDRGENEELRAATLELKSKLISLGLVNDASLSNMLRSRQEDLSMLIAKDIEKFNNNDGTTTLSKEIEDLSLKGEEGNEYHATTKKGGKNVYELYRDTTTKSTSSNVPREILLEERLRKLELALGSSSTTTPAAADGSDKSIMERIEEAEKLTKQVDTKSIDKLAAKAKVIRADLEAAARAKTKLSSKSSSSSSNNATSGEDAQMISKLHAQLLELEGISSYLPQLTLRLVELSNLHTSASNFSSRLSTAETAVNRCESMLVNLEETLNTMEEGWKSNMAMIESNVGRLDELLSLANKK